MYRKKLTPIRKQMLFTRAFLCFLCLILLLALSAPVALAKTYVIRDGQRTVTYTTFATDPADVLGEAGIGLGEQDTYTTQTIQDGQAIHIRRIQNVTVIYHGQTTNVTTFGETAGELLLRLGLDITGEDVVSHGMDMPTYDGMTLRVDRIVTLTQTYTAPLPHDTLVCLDAAAPEGKEEVFTPGIDGELLCTADITYINGTEAARTVHRETVIKAPVTEIIGIGTRKHTPEPEPVITDSHIQLPTGELLTYSGTDTIRATAYTHSDEGCDLTTATGTTVHQGTVAVDPRYIPYGTRMFIVSNDGEYVYGICQAEDCGGSIKGDRVDLYFPTHEACMNFGKRVCTIYYLT